MEFAEEVIQLGPEAALARFPPSLQELPFSDAQFGDGSLQRFEIHKRLIAALYVYIKAEVTLQCFTRVDPKTASDGEVRAFFVHNGWICGEGTYDCRVDISNAILTKIGQLFVEMGWGNCGFVQPGHKFDVQRWTFSFMRKPLPYESDLAYRLSMSLKVTARAVGLTRLFHDFRDVHGDPKNVFRERLEPIYNLIQVMRKQLLPVRIAMHRTMCAVVDAHRDGLRNNRHFHWARVPLGYGMFIMNTQGVGWDNVMICKTPLEQALAALFVYSELPVLQKKVGIASDLLLKFESEDVKVSHDQQEILRNRFQVAMVVLTYMLPTFHEPIVFPVQGNETYTQVKRVLLEQLGSRRAKNQGDEEDNFVKYAVKQHDKLTDEITRVFYLNFKAEFDRLWGLSERCYFGIMPHAFFHEVYQIGKAFSGIQMKDTWDVIGLEKPKGKVGTK